MAPAWMLAVVLAGDPGTAAAGEVTGGVPGKVVEVGRYRLKADDRGGYLSETEVFVARIAPDGSVTFGKKPRLPGPAVWPVLVAAQLLKEKINGPGPASHQGTMPTYEAKVPMLMLGEDDVRKDSHHAHKMAFLEATARLRAQMRAAQPATGQTPVPAPAASTDRALEAWRRRIEAMASDASRPAVERRRTLFELWDECDDSPHGAAARAAVESTARHHFPPAHPDAYRPDELARLNRNRPAAQPFNPYRPPSPPPPPQ